MCKTHIYHIWKVEIIKKMFYLGWKRRETLWAYLTMSPATMNPSTASIRNGREQRWWWCWRDIKIYPRQLHGKTRNPGTDQAGIRLKKATMDVCRGNFHPCKPCPSSARQFQSLRRSYLFWMSAPAERKQSRRVEKSDLLGGGGAMARPDLSMQLSRICLANNHGSTTFTRAEVEKKIETFFSDYNEKETSKETLQVARVHTVKISNRWRPLV